MSRLLALASLAIALAVPAWPQEVLLHIEGNRAIVAEGGSRTIQVRDLATGAQIWSGAGPSNPHLAASANGTAAVIDLVSSTAHVVDFQRRAITPIRLPAGPVAAAYAGERLFVVCGDTRRLVAIDGAAITATTQLPRDPAFLAVSGDRLYVYSRAEGTLLRIDPRTLNVEKSLSVGAFASDLEASEGIGYLVFPAEAAIAAVRLSDLTEMERFRVGAVPVDLAIRGDILAVADPASKKLWRTERTRSFSSAFFHGFLRGLIGLGMNPPVSPDFPSPVDRVMTDGRALVAFDSERGSLFRIGEKPKLAATDIDEGSIALSNGRLYLWDSTPPGSLRRIE